ncbi:hypothetical protein [Arthrobacter sp. JSM 101049]|uniref:hypothetical protein n=1 Tax=Arthrobacter sp. JSM 101049 TaxID=929097 RepID=UPI00356648AA
MEEAADSNQAIYAWGDESMRSVGVPAPIFLLGAVLTVVTAAALARETIRSVNTTGHKLHWRDLEHKDKLHSARAIADLKLDHVVVAAGPLDPKRQERARAKCLERLCWEIETRGGKNLYLEARTPSLNRRDRALIPQLRGAKALPLGRHQDLLPGSRGMSIWRAF